jgi:hypothetical protein
MNKMTLVLTVLAGFCMVNHTTAKDADAKTGDFRNAAKTSIPNNAHSAFTLAEAQKDAGKKRRPLVILLEPHGSAKELDSEKEEATKVFWGLQEECIMVVVNKSTWNPLPEEVKGRLQAPVLGKAAPRILVIADDGKTALAGLSAEKLAAMTIKEIDGLGKEFRKLSATKTVSKTFPPPSPAEAPAK